MKNTTKYWESGQTTVYVNHYSRMISQLIDYREALNEIAANYEGRGEFIPKHIEGKIDELDQLLAEIHEVDKAETI